MCLIVVAQNGIMLQSVKNQTLDICMTAIKQNQDAIEYVDVKRFPEVFEFYKLLYS